MGTAFVSSFTPCARTIRSSTFSICSQSARPARPSRATTDTTPKMFFGIPFWTKEVVAIPQNDERHKAKRKAAVEVGKEQYQWIYNVIGDAAMIEGFPNNELRQIQFGWIEGIIFVLARVAINTYLNDADEDAEDGEESSMIGQVSSIAAPLLLKMATGSYSISDINDAGDKITALVRGHPRGTGVTIEDYKDQFQNLKLDTVAKLNQFLRDDIFGWYRVAGPNPMRLTKLPGKATDMFPELDNNTFQGIFGFSGDTLEAAQAEGRLYYVDYAEFENVPVGKDPDGSLKKSFVYAPKALLAVPRNASTRETVLPIAIRCGQDQSKFPMYTANADHSDSVVWLAAKLTVQISDAVLHEAVYHLGRTHLLTEVFVCSSYRTMPPQHPIFKLLREHFYGTTLINTQAAIRLINNGGIIDEITAPPIDLTRQIAASGVTDKNFLFNEWMPDVELKSRNVMDPNLKYPYRDDALELWQIVNEWVRSYLSNYYKNDADVLGDYELQNWCEEVSGPGKLNGFGDAGDGKIKTFDYLVRAVSMIIFTASVQHAAVNFPQGTLMQFTPAMPLGGYAPPPTEPKPFSSVNDWVTKMIPDLEKAEAQLQTAETIGVFVYSRLGEYGKNLDFGGEPVKDALEEFQEQLGEVGARIQRRNKEERNAGLPVYKYLIPKNIPQSINV